jgi:carbamoyltransferase
VVELYILGISCFYHDAAACLLKDGKPVSAAEEERFTRIKHDISFPTNAIKFCLEEAGIRADDLDYVTFYEKPLLKFERLLSQHLETFPLSFSTFYNSIPSWTNEKLNIKAMIKEQLDYKGDILFINHHLSHAASAFLVSPFKEAAILTVDGVGEWPTTTLGFGKGNKIKILKEIHFPHSLGLLYSTVTAHLGFRVNNDEYKVMALSAYGKPRYYENFRKLIKYKDDGSFRLNMKYFAYHYKPVMPSKKFSDEFGESRKPGSRITQRHKDIACSLQNIIEEILFKIMNHLHEIVDSTNLCMAGGVALNSVVNGKIVKNTSFKNVYIQPAASDAGGSLGSAMFVYNHLLNNKRKYVMNHVYLGPSFSEKYIENFLKDNNIRYKKLSEKQLCKKVAKLILENNIVGWFQGKMEWGPRALGNRSILANPCNPQIKDILNKKVKKREPFRPFAPTILENKAKDYFKVNEKSAFMQFVFPVKKTKRKNIPSALHIDGTARPQMLRKKDNERFYRLVKEFEKLTGVPLLINTSFNVRGEPIVCTPEDAYSCFMNTGIDFLIIERFMLSKSGE